MTISAKQVMDLRASTGMPMMQCKRALEAEGGDYEKAVDRLRKEGLKVAEKRADRVTKDGLVRLRLADDGRRATLVAVGCETEPVARTELFRTFADALVEHVDQEAPSDVDALLQQPWSASRGETVEQILTGLVAQIREKLEVVTLARLTVDGPGVASGYLHHDQRNGAIVALSAPRPDAELSAFARQLCMHIVFAKPTAVTREEIPEDVRRHELDIYRAQVAADPKMKGKPPSVIDKVVEGRMAAFYQQAVLNEQLWALPGSEQKVGDLLKARGATVRAFRRAQLGG